MEIKGTHFRDKFVGHHGMADTPIWILLDLGVTASLHSISQGGIIQRPYHTGQAFYA